MYLLLCCSCYLPVPPALLAGCVLDVVLVSLMAPRAVLGGKAAALGQSALQKWLAGIPSAALEASIKGEPFVAALCGTCQPAAF
jgi:hypothetical protein